MNKRFVLLMCLLAMTYAATMRATSELRTPLGRFGDVWLDFRYLGNATSEDEWAAIVQNALITRSSSTTFAQLCPAICNDTNKITSKTAPLSSLFFNQANFEGQQIFYGGNLDGRDSGVPSLVSTVLSPRVTYEEWCVSIGLHAYRDLKTEKRWRLGGRIGLPIKSIRIQNDNTCCTSFTAGAGGSSVPSITSNSVIDCRQEFNASNGATPSDICAYRLDYLASLQMPNGQPLVVFGDGTEDNPTQIAGRVVDDYFFEKYQLNTNTLGGYSDALNCVVPPSGSAPNAPVYLMRQSTGAMPFDPIFSPSSQAGVNGNYILTGECAKGFLPADGNAGADGDRYRFDNSINYKANLGADPAAQAQWFVIPVASSNSYKVPELTDEIFNVIEYVTRQGNGTLNPSEEETLQFFANRGIFLSQSENIVGAGDLEIDIYGGRYWEKSYINGYLGFRLPTGKEMDYTGQVYFQSPGHNGHFELMVAIDGGVQFNNIIAFQGDAGYHAVLRHTERRAAPFQGATIRNIGPTIDADVSWGWFQLNAGFTLFHPQDPDLGCTLGYEFYAKQKDSVHLCATTATDLLGGTYPVCAELLEQNTNTQTNKIRGTCFYKIGYAEFIGGAYYTFAGKHAMKEVGWHVGLNVNF